MKHKEEVYLYILENRDKKLTQDGIARALGISLSTVNNALKPLRAMQAVEVKPRQLIVRDVEKILTYWATIRNLSKDTIYKTHIRAGVKEIENSMPAGAVFSAFSGYKFAFNDVPADYSEVYAYAPPNIAQNIEKRFPKKRGPENLFVLKSSKILEKMAKNNIAPKSLLYADLWNVKGWYAKDFLNALGEKLNG